MDKLLASFFKKNDKMGFKWVLRAETRNADGVFVAADYADGHGGYCNNLLRASGRTLRIIHFTLHLEPNKK